MSSYDLVGVIGSVVATIGGASVIVGGCSAILAKIWINRILEKEKSKYAQDLEAYRNKLSELSYEHQVKFSKLHEKRADVVSETYRHLRDAFNAVSNLAFATEEYTEANLKLAKDALDGLNQYYPKRRIFIKHSTASKIDRFRAELGRVIEELECNSYANDFSCKFERIYTDLSGTLTELELDFRELLGEKVER